MEMRIRGFVSYSTHDRRKADEVKKVLAGLGVDAFMAHDDIRQFLAICRWKTSRSQSRRARNDEKTIRIISQAALATSDEALKMDLLRLLS